MINVPLQDDIYAHRLLFELLCWLYDLLFARDLWTFHLKIREELKTFFFFFPARLKNKKIKGVGWGDTDDSFWPEIKHLESNQSLVTEAYKDLNTRLLENKFKEEIQDGKFWYLLDVLLCLDVGIYIARFAGMISNVSSHTAEAYRDANERTKCVCCRVFLTPIFQPLLLGQWSREIQNQPMMTGSGILHPWGMQVSVFQEVLWNKSAGVPQLFWGGGDFRNF